MALAEAAQTRYGFNDFKLKGGVFSGEVIGGHVTVPDAAGLGVQLDRDAVQSAHVLYLEHGLGARDDAQAMQYLVPDWRFDPKRPCMVR